MSDRRDTTRDERVLRMALSYLCTKHDTVLAGVTSSGVLTNELLTSEAVKRLSDSLKWAEKYVAAMVQRESDLVKDKP